MGKCHWSWKNEWSYLVRKATAVDDPFPCHSFITQSKERLVKLKQVFLIWKLLFWCFKSLLQHTSYRYLYDHLEVKTVTAMLSGRQPCKTFFHLMARYSVYRLMPFSLSCLPLPTTSTLNLLSISKIAQWWQYDDTITNEREWRPKVNYSLHSFIHCCLFAFVGMTRINGGLFVHFSLIFKQIHIPMLYRWT